MKSKSAVARQAWQEIFKIITQRRDYLMKRADLAEAAGKKDFADMLRAIIGELGSDDSFEGSRPKKEK